MADEAAKHLEVALVAAERTVWQGQAKIVIARTTDGDVGILPGHAPLLGLLQGGSVQVRTVDDEYFVAAAPDGFISVANDRVSILAAGSIRPHNVAEIVRKTGVDEVHLRAQAATEANPGSSRSTTSPEVVRAVTSALR